MKAALSGMLAVCALAAWTVGQEPGAPPSPSSKPFALERVSWSKDADGPSPIRAIEVRNDYGDIRARLTQDRRIEAWGMIQRLGRGAEGVGLTVERRGGVVALLVACSGRIQDALADPPKDSVDRLDLTVFVPAGVALGAQTLRGIVEARGLRSDVTAATLEGSIFVATTGSVQARSEGGALTVVLEAEAGTRPLVMETVSGPIDLTLPAGVDLEVRAETAASLTSAFPLRYRRTSGRRRATGTIGRPLRDLLVRSERGEVILRRGPR